MATRVCKKCGLDKEHVEFISAPKCRHGITWTCKKCQNIYQRKRQAGRRTDRAIKFEEARQLLKRGLKECSGCRVVKSVDDFWKNSRWPNGISPRCKECKSAANKNWMELNKARRSAYKKEYLERDGSRELIRASSKRYAQATPRNVMSVTLRHGLRRRPTDNPATIDDLMLIWRMQNGLCAVTGFRMTWGQGRVLPTSISLDRIDPDGGYSKDNIRLVCQAVNAFRGRMPDADMLIMAQAIVHNMTLRPIEHDDDADRSWIGADYSTLEIGPAIH